MATNTAITEACASFTLHSSADRVLELLCDPKECTAETLEEFAALVKLVPSSDDGSVPTHVDVPEFIHLLDALPCLDVRAPSEYAKGHVPSAQNLALFSDEERAEVGTRFKKQGRSVALQYGMGVVRPKLQSLQQQAQDIVARHYGSASHHDNRVLVHCWRGGMRSHAIAWLLRYHTSLQPILLTGGYKAFRHWAQHIYGPIPTGRVSHVDMPAAEAVESNPPAGPPIVIIGGRTGVGKTKVLLALEQHCSQQVLDLEGMACHKGSSFGWVNNPSQPSPSQFENDVACRWRTFDAARPVFVEDEGPNVGSVSTPRGLYLRMRQAPLVVRLLSCMPQRVQILVEDYYSETAQANTPDYDARMRKAIKGLQKRLGPERCEALLNALDNDDGATVAKGLLEYYDTRYDRHIQNAGGTGSGGGERTATMIDVSTLQQEQPDEAATEQDFDANLIAERVVAAVEAFFAK
eukprot:TRINITY_DN17368_c0_g1_i1.p1 TRINITY_DN17368_c0_g1~~TRINITY_DN17368_c0_g1_i1.p1  ORF type:complete len:518 (+),score=105.49 TRINITY_DN17368_c0_g1_i1:163-1554(+)